MMVRKLCANLSKTVPQCLLLASIPSTIITMKSWSYTKMESRGVTARGLKTWTNTFSFMREI